MKIAALLTGKKNSSLKNKNILKIKNKPIFAFPAIAAKKSKIIDNFFVSSDSKYILNHCHKLGYKRISRPKRLASRNSKHYDVLLHALKYMKKENYYPDILVVLLANAPVIKTKWISECVKKIRKNKNLTAVVPVVLNNDHNPLRAKKIVNGYIRNFNKTKKNISSNRQDLEESFFLCHNFWVLKVKSLLENNGEAPWSFLGKKVKSYIVPVSIDIHNKLDYEIAKIILKDGKF